jgi:hypothetical protein
MASYPLLTPVIGSYFVHQKLDEGRGKPVLQNVAVGKEGR